MVFIRSFFVGQVRTPEMTIEEFLDFTFKRLSKDMEKKDQKICF